MNHIHDALSRFSAEEIRRIVIWAVIIHIVVLAATLRTATRWCASFTPLWGRVFGALIVSFVINLVVGVTLSNTLGLWTIAVSFLFQALAYKSILGERGVSDVTFLQAIFTCILQAIFVFITYVCLACLAFMGSIFFKAAHYTQKPLEVPGEVPVIAEVKPATPVALPPPRGEFATVEQAQKEAVRRYPDLGVVGSAMNKAFVSRYHAYQQSQPQFFYNISWPLQLADEVAKEQGIARKL